MNIDIWFDFICPFSYLGKLRFDKALSEFEHKNNVKVTYHNYCIAPYIEKCLDMNAHEYLAYHKDISYDKAVEIHEKLTKLFAAEGVIADFSKLIPTTSKKAHQILKLISDIDQVNAYIDYVFKAHFEEGKDIGGLDILIDIGSKVGINALDIEAVFNTDMYEQQIKIDYEYSKELGLSGVPAFVVNKKYYLLGGQPYDAFVEMLEDLYEQENSSVSKNYLLDDSYTKQT